MNERIKKNDEPGSKVCFFFFNPKGKQQRQKKKGAWLAESWHCWQTTGDQQWIAPIIDWFQVQFIRFCARERAVTVYQLSVECADIFCSCRVRVSVECHAMRPTFLLLLSLLFPLTSLLLSTYPGNRPGYLQ